MQSDHIFYCRPKLIIFEHVLNQRVKSRIQGESAVLTVRPQSLITYIEIRVCYHVLLSFDLIE